jgi:hypothetical protein
LKDQPANPLYCSAARTTCIIIPRTLFSSDPHFSLQSSVSQLGVAPAKRISKQNCNMMSDLLGYNYCSLGVSNLTLTACGGRWCSCRTGPPTASAM